MSFSSSRFLLMVLVLGGCTLPWKKVVVSSTPPVPYHESWCYKTLAQIDCYTAPQDMAPERLVSVDPAWRYPATAEAHAKALAESRKAPETP